jgi:hypothetical protein
MNTTQQQDGSRSFSNGNGPRPDQRPDWVGQPAHWWLMV